MKLQERYRAVDEMLARIDFEKIFTGFHKYRFALYNSEEICLEGELMAYQQEFFGNTALLYEGEYIAIWNVGADDIRETELLAASLVHEMFHCHQYTLGEKRFPSDLAMLNYPEDTAYFAEKYQENCLLAEAYERTDRDAFLKFAAIRDRRMKNYPAMVREELKTETLEGMAEYAGLKALEQLDRERFCVRVREYLERLRAESAMQFDVRRISYYTGAVFFLCLEKLGYTVCDEIGCDKTLYERLALPTDGEAENCRYAFIEREYGKLIEERKRKIDEHIAKTLYTECEGRICGYDPMNMFRVGNVIYCSNIVFLKTGDTVQEHRRTIVLALQEDSNQDIKGYY